MYRQFTKNMKFFLELNKGEENNYRYNLAKDMDALLDLEDYKSIEFADYERYKRVARLIWSIKDNIERYPSFKVLSWELWGYGFDGDFFDVNEEELEEQLKLVDLLLGTQYWH